MATDAIIVDGYRDLVRAFAKAERTVNREFRATLREAAEPVRADAEGMAVARIEKVGVPWSRMKIGVTTRMVYVAPRQRGTRSRSRRRPNLAGLLLDRAMTPALEQNRAAVVRSVESMLGDVERAWDRG
jgi:hypothetical protein